MQCLESNIVGDRLTFKIDTEEALEINDLVKSLKSISEEYKKFSQLTDVNVKVSEVRKGSFEFDLILSTLTPLLPLMSDMNTTVDFIQRIKDVKDFFIDKNESSIVNSPTIEEAKMLNSVSSHSQNVYNGCTINLYNDKTYESFNLDQSEAKIVTESSNAFILKQKELYKKELEKKSIFNDRVIKFVQTRNDNKDYGNKSICENLSKKKLKQYL